MSIAVRLNIWNTSASIRIRRSLALNRGKQNVHTDEIARSVYCFTTGNQQWDPWTTIVVDLENLFLIHRPIAIVRDSNKHK